MKPNFIETLSRRAKRYVCPQCSQICIRGLDADNVAGVAIVDTRPVGVMGELDALMRGRATYSLRMSGGRLELDFRDEYRVKGEPPGTEWIDVLAQHSCGWAPANVVPSALRNNTFASQEDCPF